jgi:hypothetical protein
MSNGEVIVGAVGAAYQVADADLVQPFNYVYKIRLWQ